ncbi:MarR family transcriptional regulator [Microbacterium pseudoresistens]|uniref:DNA-binding MarR family transcriptional regulator n=1 Tax=Microbacterium pseudoresistens TaxID=640634 RepID=A0A7Y9JLQ9_9MICO|nr:MarR family transcriptional regulator [Microbacterium pseudoresistens]NYD53590.1 DNA-binding MarR family transcriptional regulator [Microbacterium pseudoresistens]
MSDRKLAVEAWENLFRAQHELFVEMSSDFDGAGLSLAEYDVLLTVTRCAKHTARLREVTARMLISQPSVSRLVDRMVARGLISKDPDPRDGRGSLIHATPEGVRAFHRLAAVHATTIAGRMSALSPDEQRTLRDLTRKLRGAGSAAETE